MLQAQGTVRVVPGYFQQCLVHQPRLTTQSPPREVTLARFVAASGTRAPFPLNAAAASQAPRCPPCQIQYRPPVRLLGLLTQQWSLMGSGLSPAHTGHNAPYEVPLKSRVHEQAGYGGNDDAGIEHAPMDTPEGPCQ
jgi:hypothetical protein